MKEFVQGLICLWEIMVPYLFAEKNLEKRNMHPIWKGLWFLGMGVNLAMLVMQRRIIMYSRWYLFVSVAISAILLLGKYRVKLIKYKT